MDPVRDVTGPVDRLDQRAPFHPLTLVRERVEHHRGAVLSVQTDGQLVETEGVLRRASWDNGIDVGERDHTLQQTTQPQYNAPNESDRLTSTLAPHCLVSSAHFCKRAWCFFHT